MADSATAKSPRTHPITGSRIGDGKSGPRDRSLVVVKLSPLTKQYVAALFAPTDVAEAESLLATECAENLPLVSDPTPEGLERLRFAAIRLSEGKVTRL